MQPDAAVLLDLDGTLADTLTDLAEATNAVLLRHGLPVHPTNAYRRFVGNGARVLIERALGEHATPALTEVVYREYVALYQETCLNTVRPYEGIPEMLEALEQRGAVLGIVTNKPEPQAIRIAEQLFGKNRFCAVCGTREDLPKKPDPTVALQVLREIGVPVERALFVGDSDVDVYTAKNIGCAGIGVEWGFRGKAELIAAGSEFMAATPQDVVAIFDRLFALAKEDRFGSLH